MSNFRKDDTERPAVMLKALASPQRLHLFMKLTNCCEPEGCCTVTPDGLCRCVGEAPADPAATGGTGASCGCGTTASGGCPARAILVALVILAAAAAGIWSLLAPA